MLTEVGALLMRPAYERWAEAVAIDRQYGRDAALFIAGLIGQLALQGDEKGIARWQSIATCYDQLRKGTVQ